MPLLHLEDYVSYMLQMKLSLVDRDNLKENIFLLLTAEKILFMTSIWGIMGSFDGHNRLNLGHCSKA